MLTIDELLIRVAQTPPNNHMIVWNYRACETYLYK